MTGPEYADRFRKLVDASDITVMLESMVLSLTDDKELTVLSPKFGLCHIKAKSVVLAMGCRERTAGAIALPGTRPAGIYTAGMAQKICNIDGYLVGKEVVILGSGDIGLIMARRMTTEGAKVKLVLELMPFSSGLKRNIVQCLDDYGIPIKFSHTITRIVGSPRMTGLYYAPVGADRKPDLSKEEYISADTLLLSVGLIPENDLLNGTRVELSRITSGAVVDENRMTNVEGIFSAGNVLHVHDLVDNVSHEAEIAGEAAARFALGTHEEQGEVVSVTAKDGVRYSLPQRIHKGEGKVQIFFRTGDVYKNCKLIVESGDEVLVSKKCQVLAPGEMGNVIVDKAKITGDIVVRLEK
jgi:thioredoxin reductase